MAMSSEEAATSPRNLTYREEDVDNTLDDHEQRISRLEKIALVVVGYGLAEGSKIILDIAQLI